MSQSGSATTLGEQTKLAAEIPLLTIDVNREGEPDQKMVRFTLVDQDIDNKDYAYGIGHVIGLEPMVASVAIYSATSDVLVTLKPQESMSEELVESFAKAMGKVVGFNYDHIMVNTSRLE